VFEDKAKAKDVRPEGENKDRGPRTKRGQKFGTKAKAKNKLKVKTKDIQKLLPWRHINVNWGD